MTRALSLPGQPMTADDVHAFWDDRDAAGRAADLAAGSLTIRRLKAREAVHKHGARLLRALRIDSSDIRWKALRTITKRWRSTSIQHADEIVILTLAAGFAMENAALRGKPDWPNVCDMREARARIKAELGDEAAQVFSQSRMFASALRSER